MTHDYTATACAHGLHDRCRLLCKFCPALCECLCHAGQAEPYPGYDKPTEDRLRAELHEALTARLGASGPRGVELLTDIVTGVLAGIDREAARMPHVKAGEKASAQLVQLIRDYLDAHDRSAPNAEFTATLANEAIDWWNREHGRKEAA